MQTREQKILAALGSQLPDDEQCHTLRKRVRKLPSLFLRHGPAQVFLYLGDGNKEDKQLHGIHFEVFKALRPNSPLVSHKGNEQLKALAAQALPDRLADQALCVEIASWMSRSIEARYQEVEAKRQEERRLAASEEAR